MSVRPLKIVASVKDKTYFNKIVGNVALMDNVTILASSPFDTDISSLCTELTPDVLIYELSFNSLNQNKIIKEIHNQNENISIIATATSKDAENNIPSALENGANIYMSNLDKPEILESTLKIISRQKYTYINSDLNNEIPKKVSNILLNLKLPAHYIGYHYLKRCIISTILRENKLPDSASEMYRKLAVEYNTTSKNVERAIYSAVCHINKVCSKEYILNSILEYDVNANNFSLNAKELVALIADQLRLKYNIY